MATKKEMMDALAGFSDEADILVEMIPQYKISAKEPVKAVNSDTAPTEVIDAEPAVADELAD